MSDVLTALGILTVGQAVPGMSILEAIARAKDLELKAELQGKLAGALAVTAALTIPPLPTVRVVAAAKVAAQLAINPQFSLPSLQLAANVSLIASLRAKLGFTLPDFHLGTAGVAAYTYSGQVGAFGPKLQGALGGGLPGGQSDDACYGVVLTATAPQAIAALAQLFAS